MSMTRMQGTAPAEAGRALLTAALSGLRVRDALPPSPVPAFHSWQTVQVFFHSDGPGAVQAGPAGSAAAAFPLRGFDGAVAGVLTPTDIARTSQASALYRGGRAR
jgi:hypothetical protein